jgi:hypothetical protein
MSPFQRPLYGAIVGLIVGVVIVVTMSSLDVHVTRRAAPTPVVITTPQAADAFVVAWQRMGESAWAVDSAFTRRLNDGRHLNALQFQAQRGPDYVSRAFGSVTLFSGGRRYACGTGPDETTSCRDAGAADHREQAASDVAAVRLQVTGTRALYDVQQQSAQCFGLYARPMTAVLQWGERATFCFDAATGAMRRSEFDRTDSTDVVQATSIRAPGDADFVVPGSASNG